MKNLMHVKITDIQAYIDISIESSVLFTLITPQEAQNPFRKQQP
jgi:hypothetical protein